MIHGVIIGLDQCHRGLYMLLEKGFVLKKLFTRHTSIRLPNISRNKKTEKLNANFKMVLWPNSYFFLTM